MFSGVALSVWKSTGQGGIDNAALSLHAAQSRRVCIARGSRSPPSSQSLLYCVPLQVADNDQQCPFIQASNNSRSDSVAGAPLAPISWAASALGKCASAPLERVLRTDASCTALVRSGISRVFAGGISSARKLSLASTSAILWITQPGVAPLSFWSHPRASPISPRATHAASNILLYLSHSVSSRVTVNFLAFMIFHFPHGIPFFELLSVWCFQHVNPLSRFSFPLMVAALCSMTPVCKSTM